MKTIYILQSFKLKSNLLGKYIQKYLHYFNNKRQYNKDFHPNF
ncbi:hypothetical protein [Helicobacter valdiviensis]|nr:hypothetical protein [Helicobacter valdiviensis]